MSEKKDVRAKVVAALQNHPLLVGLDGSFLQRLMEVGRVVTFEPGDTLSREGDTADYWLLCSGSVRVFYTSPDGLEVTVKIFRAPAAWAEMQVLTGHPHTEDCVAVDRSACLRVPHQSFVPLLDAFPRFTRNVLYDTSARFLIAAQNERALAFLAVPQRLAHLLLSYVRVYGVPAEGGVRLRIKLSQADLANGLGVARKSVTRTLTQWQQEGICRKEGTTYLILDLPRLAQLTAPGLLGVDWVAGSGVLEGIGTQRRGT